MDTVKTEPKKELDKTPQGFAKAYQDLCDAYGFRIVVSPQYLGRDDGTFSTVLNYTVGQLPVKQEDGTTQK